MIMRKPVIIIILLIAAGAIGGMALLWGRTPAAGAATAPAKTAGYQFTAVTRGTIESLVTSSGTLSPVSEVKVLPQMSGRALKVHADYNDRVRKGQLLIEIDTAMLKLEEKQSVAAVTKAKASLELQSTTVKNNEKLAAKGLLSEFDLAACRSALAVDQAELEAAEAALESVRTKIGSYAFVTSPIDGVILARNVDEGDNVVESSSSSAASLFTIAGDLSKMEIAADVDELDIGSIRKGQEARFTVEALPGRTFAGSVREVRLVPKTSSNVVSYTVIVDAPNADGKLLPGMTAEIEFIKERKDEVLIVPNAALRFTPAGMDAKEIAKAEFLAGLGDLTEEQRKTAEARYDEARKQAAAGAAQGQSGRPAGLTGVLMGGGPGGPGGPGSFGGQRNRNAAGSAGGGVAKQAARKPLWYLDAAGKLAVAMVEVGSTDGKNTEVSGQGISEGMQVILKAKVE